MGCVYLPVSNVLEETNREWRTVLGWPVKMDDDDGEQKKDDGTVRLS